MTLETEQADPSGLEIAIVGLAGRFPGAADVDTFWQNILGGVTAVSRFSDTVLLERGVPERWLADPAYVKAGIEMPGLDLFDAGFFGYTPREADYLDPQQRVFLETAWQALEHAGYGGRVRPLTGVFAGSGAPIYLLRHLASRVDLAGQGDIASLLGLMNGNDKDSLATRVAYKLDLRGPAVSVQTACSTSLVAVHMACRSLLNQETDMALAGGVWLNLMQGTGYRHQPGAILSRDGVCRAFDAEASGTAIGSGAGVVVLRRLADALAEGDTIHAVIKGSAVNNDGSNKVGYTAPSADGQAAVILAAQAMAEVPPDSIGYVEAHGTGTTLGDPIEVAALSQAFREGTDRRGFCALGSVKTNIGHLDAAAGVAGLIKATLSLRHRTLPPSLNFERGNPQIDFDASPFFVNTSAKPWPAGEAPRRAGVSAFGMGGTNAHVVIEEAPVRPNVPSGGDDLHGLRVSARTHAARDNAASHLAEHLRGHPDLSLADVAHTLDVGRRPFDHRSVVLARDLKDAARSLTERTADRYFSGQVLSEQPALAFLFPGQGAQHVQMGRDLYEREPVFRDEVDRCRALLPAHLRDSLLALMHPAAADEADSAERLAQTDVTQPALFVIEYAMARLWWHWGARPDAMLGHSLGEYVAACVAGVFSLEDALSLVVLRGQLLQATAPGGMVAVSLPESDLGPWLVPGCDLAAVNAPDLCVLSGAAEVVGAVARDLAGAGVPVRPLHVTRGFHSALVDPVLAAFEDHLSRVPMRAPTIPFISNLSGRFITPEEACDPGYWVRHARGTVRFADGLALLLQRPDRMLLEVGPGETLSVLARRHPEAGVGRPILSTQTHPNRLSQNVDQPARCLAQLWVGGLELERRTAAGARSTALRVPLPTYPFERQSYWIAPAAAGAADAAINTANGDDVGDWFHVPSWTRAEHADTPVSERKGVVLLLDDGGGLGDRLVRRWQDSGRIAVRVTRSDLFARHGERRYGVRMAERVDLERLLLQVQADLGPVSDICHLWALEPTVADATPIDWLERGFNSVLALGQALGDLAHTVEAKPVTITVVADRVVDVGGADVLCPDKAALMGPCLVLPQELPHLSVRLVDVVRLMDAPPADDRIAQQVHAEMQAPAAPSVVAFRGRQRWCRTFEPVRRELPPGGSRLRRQGVYVITGGLGGVGLSIAKHLASAWQARLVLVGRAPVPDRGEWAALASSSGPWADTARSLMELEALGAEVLPLQADVTDAPRIAEVMAQVKRRFGPVNGLFHAAGVPGGGLAMERSRESIARVFAPKVTGTRCLLEALRGHPLDVVLLCSSLTAVTGGFGQVDYCAANAVLDALAAQASRTTEALVLAVNWDVWRGVGMAARQQLPDGVGIAPEQAGDLIERLLSDACTPQVIVSTIDLAAQFRQMNSPALIERLGAADPSVRLRHPRPPLATPYTAPADELEVALAAQWSEFLGISPVGVHDNLFELGGDSLMAIQLLARVRASHGVEVHPAPMFKTPTIARLAELIETRLIEELEGAAAPSNV